MVANGITPLTKDLLPLNYAGFWEFYGKKSPGRGLQRLLSSEMEASKAAEMLIRADKDLPTKARLRAVRGRVLEHGLLLSH